MVAVLLVVLLAILALAIDGGLLLVKYRQVRRANDAAALAAAIECVKNPTGGTDGADQKANEYAQANGAESPPWTDDGKNVYPNGCQSKAGKVTVYYGAWQDLEFGPAIGVTSPKHVTATATATWGAAGSVGTLIPLALAEGTDLGKCTATANSQPPIGATCKLFWSTSDPTNGTWGVVDLRCAYWSTCNPNLDDSTSGCENQPNANLVNGSGPNDGGWMEGISASFFSSMPVPPNQYVYACAGNGGLGADLTNAINQWAACPDGPENTLTCKQPFVYMPVFRPYPISVLNQSGNNIYKYAIIGFAGLRIIKTYQAQGALDACGVSGSAGGGGNSRCLIASWQGFATGGLSFGNNNFGATNVALTG